MISPQESWTRIKVEILLGEEGVVPTSIGEVLKFLVESVHGENTHVVLESEPMVGYIVSVDPVLKSVGKQVL